MRDYAELTKTLRYCSEYDNCGSRCPRFESNGDCVDGLMKDAADAIEELQTIINSQMTTIGELRAENERAADKIEELLDERDDLEAIAKNKAKIIEKMESEQREIMQQIPTWISVEDELPKQTGSEARGTYLVHLASGCIKTLFYEFPFKDINRLFPEGWHKTGSPVTHWMPLPEPPKGVE